MICNNLSLNYTQYILFNVTFAKRNKNTILKLQAYIRGTMIRKAFKEAKHTYFYI